MPTVYGLHEIELQPGVEPEEYERFFAEEAEEIAPSPMVPGWKVHLLKGERGARVGKFLVLLEIESVEARDWYFPNPGEESEEVTRFLNSTQKLRRRSRNGTKWAHSDRKPTFHRLRRRRGVARKHSRVAG
jgi:hypothetical protein